MNQPIQRLRISATNRPLDCILHWHREGYMELNPPYQRGDVWGPTRRRNLIRSVLLGVPIPSIIINDRSVSGWDDMLSCVVIDGKQRITSLLMFLQDQLTVPGWWFGMEGDIVFSDLPIPRQRGFRHTPISFCEGSVGSLEEEQEVFDLVNFGGVRQGERDEE